MRIFFIGRVEPAIEHNQAGTEKFEPKFADGGNSAHDV